MFGNTRGKPGNKIASKFDSSVNTEFMKEMKIQIIRIIKHLLSSLGRESVIQKSALFYTDKVKLTSL